MVSLFRGVAQIAKAWGDFRNWVGPVPGARFRMNLRKGWFAMLQGGAGGFGARSQVA
jgi:hypothetical protein